MVKTKHHQTQSVLQNWSWGGLWINKLLQNASILIADVHWRVSKLGVNVITESHLKNSRSTVYFIRPPSLSLPSNLLSPSYRDRHLHRDMCQHLGSREMLEPVCTSACGTHNKLESVSALCRQLRTSLRKNAQHTIHTVRKRLLFALGPL